MAKPKSGKFQIVYVSATRWTKPINNFFFRYQIKLIKPKQWLARRKLRFWFLEIYFTRCTRLYKWLYVIISWVEITFYAHNAHCGPHNNMNKIMIYFCVIPSLKIKRSRALHAGRSIIYFTWIFYFTFVSILYCCGRYTRFTV